ncbi:centrosomal protein of 89 kDa isoform X2 [Hemitrygon akajei]|uniref:centrosomal protein of 89 kDa isoform X2 n=1 Tax=Hemitrygon akajei TaxID=2704970 RepID=UPI003BF95BEA
MPFTFRRQNNMPFLQLSHFSSFFCQKHIAHGLVPAATIAPRAAVPRTPPPRSPNSSPERPRSALAAVILTSCLTGRTVAVPQPHLALPRQRSYSESDGTRSEHRSFVEPYASISNLGFRNEWQSPVRGRPPLPLPSESDEEYRDEEEEEGDGLDLDHLSNKSDEPHYYILEKEEEIQKKDLIYAVPCKEKQQDEIPISISSEMTDVSSDDVTSITRIHESKPGQEHSPVHAPRIKKRTKEEEHCSYAFSEKEALEQQQQTEKQHVVPEFSLVTGSKSSISVENPRTPSQNKKKAKIKKVSDVTKSDKNQELVSLRQQAQELVDENDALKMTIHRLSVELSHYQSKYRSVDKEGSHHTGLPPSGTPPSWLVDMKYLSPLMLAYEDQLQKKDAILEAHEKEMKNFRARVEDVVKENKQLHQRCTRNGVVSNTEWQQLQDQAKLVLEENEVLMEQLELLREKGKDSHNRHVQEVSKLTKQLILLEAEKQSQHNELQEARQHLKDLSSKYDQVKASLRDKMGVDEHKAALNDLQRKLLLEQENHHAEVEELMGRIASLKAEKKGLLVERTELIADNKTLEAELHTALKSNRLAQKKIGLLKQQMEEAVEKEVAAHQYLANLISLAEKAAHERDQLVHKTKSLTNEKNGVLNRMLADTVHLGKLEEKVKVYKTQAAVKLGDINNRMKEQEEDFARRSAQYQREIRHLQQLVKDKQESLDGLLEQKRQVESELETVWESTMRENQRMKDLLCSTLQSTNLWDTVNFDQLDIEEIPCRYLGRQSDLRASSYCDVIVSSARRVGDRRSHENNLQPNNNKKLPAHLPESGDCTVTQQRKQKPREENIKSPMFDSDSDHQRVTSSDESDKNEHDFYS